MNSPLVSHISRPKKALKVAMVMTMEMMRKRWISVALIRPSPAPASMASAKPITQLPPPICMISRIDDILHHAGRDGETDVDAARDQHHQQADGPDQVDGVVVQAAR